MSKKVCLITMMNIMAIPYLSKYTELMNCNYDIIYWNRYGVIENSNAAVHYSLEYPLPKGSTKLRKLIGYLKFKAFADKILRENDYQKVVLLSGNVAVLLKNVLLAKYRSRYLIDIRDYFMEHNRFYYNAEKQLIDHSGLAVISSDAYRKFLPLHDYVVVHNTPNLSTEAIAEFRQMKAEKRRTQGTQPIRLSFIGGVRFFEQDKRILRYFANDERYVVQYFGSGAGILEQYCRDNGISNTVFHDRFAPDQTLNFYKQTDVILNLYGSGTPLLDYALSNKLYYAAWLTMPILVCPGTYMEEISTKYKFGFPITLDDPDSRNRLVEWHSALDPADLHDGCLRFMNTVNADNALWENHVSEFFK